MKVDNTLMAIETIRITNALETQKGGEGDEVLEKKRK